MPYLPCEQRLHFRGMSWRATFRTPAHTAKMQPLLAGYALPEGRSIFLKKQEGRGRYAGLIKYSEWKEDLLSMGNGERKTGNLGNRVRNLLKRLLLFHYARWEGWVSSPYNLSTAVDTQHLISLMKMGGRGQWTKGEIFLNNSQIVEFTPRFNMMVVTLARFKNKFLIVGLRQLDLFADFKKPMPRTEEYRADLRIFKVYEC